MAKTYQTMDHRQRSTAKKICCPHARSFFFSSSFSSFGYVAYAWILLRLTCIGMGDDVWVCGLRDHHTVIGDIQCFVQCGGVKEREEEVILVLILLVTRNQMPGGAVIVIIEEHPALRMGGTSMMMVGLMTTVVRRRVMVVMARTSRPVHSSQPQASPVRSTIIRADHSRERLKSSNSLQEVPGDNG